MSPWVSGAAGPGSDDVGSDAPLEAVYRENLTGLLRRVLVIALALGLPSIVVVMAIVGPTDPLVAHGYPPLVAYLAVYAWVLVRRPERAVDFSRVTLVLIELVWLVVMVYRLRSAPSVGEGWAELFPTTFMGLVIFLVVGNLVFASRAALANAGLLVVGVVASGLVGLAPLAGRGAFVVDTVRYAVYLGIVGLLLHVLARAKARLGLALAAAHRATAEAHQMREMAYLDPLTGAANRRRLLEEIGHQARQVGPTHPVAVLYFDLDHFKDVNDVHGHTVGDQVLTTVAQVTDRVVRHGDLVARVGGEEFVVVAPGTDHDRAVQVAERLRVVLPEEVGLAVGVRVTGSFGVVSLRPGEDPLDLLARVDALMYEAKSQGRDRVSQASA